jgi:hypothetical protein
MKTAEQFEAWLDEIEGIGPPKPKAVVIADQVVRDADPYVSRADPNSPGSNGGIVRVRRSDFVTINIPLWEAQQRQKAEDRRQRRMIDPFRLGHWDGEE